MTSQTRKDCTEAVREFASMVNLASVGKPKGKLLYVGIAGDPPGGEYAPLFRDRFDITTVDADPKWGPELVMNITDPYKTQPQQWDVIVCVQVIEHIPNIFNLEEAMSWLLKHEGYLIIDCPWNYPYHAEPPSFGDYWRITKDGFDVLFPGYNWTPVRKIITEHNTSCLYQKK